MSIFALLGAPLLAAAVGTVIPGDYGAVPQDVPDADAPVVERAQGALASLERGSLDPALLTPGFRQQFSPAVVASDASFLKGRGLPSRWYELERDDDGSRVRYTFVIVFKDQNSLSYTFGIDKASDLVDALYFRPFNTPPSY